MKKLFEFAMLGSNDLVKSAKFYDAVFITLGIKKIETTERYIVYAKANSLEQKFYITKPANKELDTNDNGTMRQTSLDTFDTYLAQTTKTLTNKTLTTPTITTPVVNTGLQLKNGATSSGFIEFFEDSDNGTNKVTLIGPSSTADVTLTLPSVAGTVATTASAADEATALAIALG